MAVFDLRAEPGPRLASITYELGIALTLGRPVVVLVASGQALPFDVDIEPVICNDQSDDETEIAAAIDRSMVWTFPHHPHTSTTSATLEYVLSQFRQPSPNVYVNQTLKAMEQMRNEPDALAVSRVLAKLFDYADFGKTVLIAPRWAPVYPDGSSPRMFHVMPFRPAWADTAAALARAICRDAGITYIRGDEAAEPNVIRSIWEEIARATHILVDMSGFNANVALELGIAHTIGKKVLIVGQGDTVEKLFPAIKKLRINTYSVNDMKRTLGTALTKFAAS